MLGRRFRAEIRKFARRSFTSNSQKTTQPPKSVSTWLYATAGLTVGIISLGGLTRLTESGLSIVEWRPITGALPPLSQKDWLVEFEKYKQFPEYEKLNQHFSLDDFKFIYWMEWSHRVLGRVIGLTYLVPAVWFWRRGCFKADAVLRRRVLGLGALIGFQVCLSSIFTYEFIVG